MVLTATIQGWHLIAEIRYFLLVTGECEPLGLKRAESPSVGKHSDSDACCRAERAHIQCLISIHVHVYLPLESATQHSAWLVVSETVQ